MGLVLLRKGSQYFIGPVFTPFDPPTCVITGPEQKMKIDDRKINRSIDENRLITVD